MPVDKVRILFLGCTFSRMSYFASLKQVIGWFKLQLITSCQICTMSKRWNLGQTLHVLSDITRQMVLLLLLFVRSLLLLLIKLFNYLLLLLKQVKELHIFIWLLELGVLKLNRVRDFSRKYGILS